MMLKYVKISICFCILLWAHKPDVLVRITVRNFIFSMSLVWVFSNGMRILYDLQQVTHYYISIVAVTMKKKNKCRIQDSCNNRWHIYWAKLSAENIDISYLESIFLKQKEVWKLSPLVKDHFSTRSMSRACYSYIENEH